MVVTCVIIKRTETSEEPRFFFLKELKISVATYSLRLLKGYDE